MWNVMVADDEAYIREALQKLIHWEKMGCTLSKVVCNGQELIDQMQEGYPDIIITDIQMPLVNGLEVCKFVYEYCPETQVILLTAYSDFEYAKTAIRYSACDYVLKISVMEELPEAVNKAIEKLEKSRREIEKTEKDEPGTLYLQIEQYIEQNFKSKISLDEIADALHANRSYLSRLYKNKKGINLFDAILDRRIEAAKEYMMNTDMKTYEISGAVGIEDAGYFSKMFKKKTGVSPKDYRKKENNAEI
jgi:two-component system, response regulator YesN